jgi:signal peptidase I
MDAALKGILIAMAGHGNPIEIRVTGDSMNPVLSHGEKIIVRQKEEYLPGDILVFFYKYGELLVHRLLKRQGERYYCKGDNAFRLEDFTKDRIVGAVVLPEDRNNNPEFMKMSLLIARLYRKSGYDAEKTMKTEQYQAYKRTYLISEDRK